MNNDKLVTVARFTNYLEAELARQLLDSQGITAFVMGENVGNMYGGVPAAIDIQLQTPESQAGEAKEILEASRQQKDEGSEQESEEDLEQDWDDDQEQEPDEDLEQE
jgi:hypothetical protein